MNEPKTWWEWLDALKQSLAMDEWHVNQLYLAFARRRGMSYMGVHQHIFEKSSMFNSFLSKLIIDAHTFNVNVLFLLVISNEMMADIYVLCSWMLNRLLVSFTSLSLSHSNGTCLNLIPKSLKVAFIQSNWAQQLLAKMYSALAVECATLFCIFDDQDFDDQDTSDLPNS